MQMGGRGLESSHVSSEGAYTYDLISIYNIIIIIIIIIITILLLLFVVLAVVLTTDCVPSLFQVYLRT